jgi:hypothetical protein
MSRIEVCVSDNNSYDHTKEVILKWSNIYKIKSIRQEKNIGGSNNQVSVLGLAASSWVMIVGDDDTIEHRNVENLINTLVKKDVNKSVFIDPRSECSKDITPGKSKRMLVRSGLKKYGFIGNHIFPKSILKDFFKSDVNKLTGWVHLYIFLKLISKNGMHIYGLNIVQKKMADINNECEDWKHEEWVQLIFMRLKVVKYALSNDYFTLSIALSIRDIFSLQFNINLIYCILCSNCNKRRFFSMVDDYRVGDTSRAQKVASFLVVSILKIQSSLIKIVPIFLYEKILTKVRKKNLKTICSRNKKNRGVSYRGY